MDPNPRPCALRKPRRGLWLLIMTLALTLPVLPAQASSSTPTPSSALASLPQTLSAPKRQLAAVAAKQRALEAAATAHEHQRLNRLIHKAQTTTWRWQRVYGPHLSPGRSPEHIQGLAYKRYVLHVWQHRAHSAYLTAIHPPNQSAWLCIHHYEGSWDDATGNGYYGGLQMDLTFQRHYGWWHLSSEGTANHWSPLEQIWVAERGRHVQGWGAWPNTARLCGLL